jgi:CBS domain-containing protein
MSIELEKAGLDRFQKITKIAKMHSVYCKDSENINEAIDRILSTGYRRLPVLSGNKMIGVVTYMDILDAFLRRQKFSEKISTIMTRDVIFCEADDSVGYVLKKFKISRRGGFPILEKKKLVGMVSERDFIKYFSDITFGMTVEELMTKKPFFVQPKISILDCLKSMVNTGYRRLPVVESKKLVGIVTGIDFLKFIRGKDLNTLNLKTPIDSLVIKNVFSITKDKDISDAIKIMKSKDIGGVPVVDKNNELEGIITERDILEEII